MNNGKDNDKNKNGIELDKDKKNFLEILKTNSYGISQLNTKYYDMKKIQNELLNYYLYKIRCELKANNCITGIKLVYKNRIDNSKIDVIKIHSKKKTSLEQEYTFDQSEFIVDVRLWLKERLIGFEITTNKGNIKKFGYGEDDKLVKIPDFENNEQVVLGFEISADDKDGITAMCCYYIRKNKYAALLHTGAIYLKIKLKDKDYKKKIEKKLKNLNQQLKILYHTCLLPDHPFFEIMKYVIN